MPFCSPVQLGILRLNRTNQHESFCLLQGRTIPPSRVGAQQLGPVRYGHSAFFVSFKWSANFVMESSNQGRRRQSNIMRDRQVKKSWMMSKGTKGNEPMTIMN